MTDIVEKLAREFDEACAAAGHYWTEFDPYGVGQQICSACGKFRIKPKETEE